MPMGVASMSFTCSMPSARMSVTWSGIRFPRVNASNAGTRLSKIRVVLPDPETPVTTVSRPLGISTSNGFTVCISLVDRCIFGLLQDLRVVIDEQHGVAVGHEVVHHAVESHDVGGVQPDGRLVEDVEHAGGAVADGAGELHPLPFAGGEGGGRAVEGEVSQP